MIPILGALASAGLNILTGAIKSKGKEAVEKIIGEKIPDDPSPEQLFKLKQLEAKHEEALLQLEIESKKVDLELARVEVDGEKNENDNVSKRWESDMGSDSWLSKNIRPIGLLATLGFVLLVIVTDAAGHPNKDSVVSLVETLAVSFVMVYAGGRTVEKAMTIRKRK